MNKEKPMFAQRLNFTLPGNKKWVHEMRRALVGQWFVNDTGHRVLILDMPKFAQSTDNDIPVYVQDLGVRLTSWYSIMHMSVIASKGTSAGAMWIDPTPAQQELINSFVECWRTPSMEEGELYQAVLAAGLKVFHIQGHIIVARTRWGAKRQFARYLLTHTC